MSEFEIEVVGLGAGADLELKKAEIALGLRDLVEDTAAFAAFTAQDYVGKQTGNLAQNIVSTHAGKKHTETAATPGQVYEAVAGVRKTAPYGRWVEEGTGIYGHRKMPIVPKHAPFLVFHWRGKLRFRRSVKGQKPQRYMRRAYDTTRDIYLPAALKELERKLNL